MLSVSNLSIQFGKRVLFDNVNTSFNNGNCYGIIGANGAGKSTFLKILSGKIDPTSGNVHLEPGKRMSVLEQDHSLFDSNSVLETVIMGDISLYKIKKEIDSLYENYSDENAEKIGSLQVKFEEMNGDGIKRLQKCEIKNKKIARKSVVANRHIFKGEKSSFKVFKGLL